MRMIKQITNNRFLNIKEVKDEAMGCSGYQYAERLGVNSVAFICYDKDKGKFLINKEATPPTGDFLVRAFGGSIDKSKTYEEIVQDEVREEAGYKVRLSKVKSVGKSFVSTQMNQYCYLYLVFVSDKQEVGREPENKTEELAEVVWMSEDEINDGDDWKAITIITKAKKLGLV